MYLKSKRVFIPVECVIVRTPVRFLLTECPRGKESKAECDVHISFYSDSCNIKGQHVLGVQRCSPSAGLGIV